MEINYKIASLKDVTDVFLLNQKWINVKNFENGYITNCFSESEILSLVQKRNIVTAEIENKIIGYYLINDLYETELTKKRKEIVSDSILNGEIPDGLYVYHTQAVVDRDYMRRGIAKKMLNYLKKQVSNRYDFLMGSIRKNNLTAKAAHVKSGWEIFHEDRYGWVVFTDVTQCL